MKNKTITRKNSINKTKEFEKKGLATHGLNVGLLCDHGCKYCSTPAMMRHRKPYFGDYGGSSFQAFESGAPFLDPLTPERIAEESRSLTSMDTVMLSTSTDAWSPEAQKQNLGRRCLENLLSSSRCRVRILTKNAAVINEYDLLEKQRDRVTLSLSLTAPQSKEHLAKVLEPNASTISERLEALEEAKRRGIPIYGMICPCIPGLAACEADFKELLQTVLGFNPSTIWTEPVNPRGKSLINSAKALRDHGYGEVADGIDAIRSQKAFEIYLNNFIKMAIQASEELHCRDLLKILVYGNGESFTGDDECVIWLKR